MKPKSILIATVLATASHLSVGQGTFVYDQQSSDESLPSEGLAGIQANQPIGQSFTPALSAVGFIRLQLFDVNPGNGLGATLLINLRANSITGTILASTDAVIVSDGFPGTFVDFIFSTAVSVTSGTTYYFQPVVQTGDAWAVGGGIPAQNYPGGTSFVQGVALPNSDLWFREGIMVPEPSSVLLASLGLVGLVALRIVRPGKPRRSA